MSVCFSAREHRRIDAPMDRSNFQCEGHDPSQLPNLTEMHESVLRMKIERMANEVVSLALLLRVMIEKWRHLVMPVGCCLFPDHERVVCDASVEVETDSMADARLKWDPKEGEDEDRRLDFAPAILLELYDL